MGWQQDLEMLNQAAALAPLNRNEHAEVIRAVGRMSSLLTDAQPEEEADAGNSQAD